MILAIDPGPTFSAYAYMEYKLIYEADILATNALLAKIKDRPAHTLAIEMIASYGMPVGKEVFETCVNIGRFAEAFSWNRTNYIYRADVKMWLCKSMKANDSTIRQRIIDLYGGREKAIGFKKNPGPLHGIKKDMWSAVAVGLTFQGVSD